MKGITFILMTTVFASCQIMQQASRHELESGYLTMKTPGKKTERIYADVTENTITVYSLKDRTPVRAIDSLSLGNSDSLCHYPLILRKQSLDIDITTILMKYHPPVSGLPAQMTVDFNAALYGGWRFDQYRVVSMKDPLENCNNRISNRGFDLGFFGGLGTTTVNAFATRNKISEEYNGMILEYGMAGFIESDVASFGMAVGFDHLVSPDRAIWIYNKKPWIGFIVGIALN